MNYVQLISAVLIVLVSLKLAEAGFQLAWQHRSKLSELNNVKLPVWAFVAFAVFILAAFSLASRGCTLPSLPWPSIVSTKKPTAVTYVHDEKAVIPSGVSAALNELNASGILATSYPDDATDGDDDVPDQYKEILKAAKESGIPCLVLSNGGNVLKIVKSPTTKAHVLEAAQ